MTNSLCRPFGSEEDSRSLDSLFESFLSEPHCRAYGWGPIQTYQSHTEIFRQDTPASAVYFIEKGSVKMTWMDEEGNEVIAGLRHKHWIIGAPAVLLEKPYSFTVTTLTQCCLRCISAQDFLYLVRTNAEFAHHLLRLLSEAIFNHTKSLVMMGCTSAKERLKALLCRFMKIFAGYPVACHGEECMRFAEGYKGDAKFPLSAQALAPLWYRIMHGLEEGESCGLRHGIPFGMVPKISEEDICRRRHKGTSGTGYQRDMR